MQKEAAMTDVQRLREQVQELQAQLAETKEMLAAAGGKETALARQHEEKLEMERQTRIAHTQAMALKRIGKRDLARGWMAWYDMFAERLRRSNMLKSAGARLLKPKLVLTLRKNRCCISEAAMRWSDLSSKLGGQGEI